MTKPDPDYQSPDLKTPAKQSHPSGLYTLFFTETWERFSYYGMRAMLVLYLVNRLGYERASALEVYGIFTGLVYMTPMLGGFLADKVLGHRKAIYIGGILMALGQFTLAASEDLLALGLGLIIIGNGFFKPNISTIVGNLYSDTDPRKDSAFTIFYVGINLGAFLAPIVCGSLRQTWGFSAGFLSAGVGMLLALVWFYFRSMTLGKLGYPPGRKVAGYVPRDVVDIALYVLGSAAFVYAAIAGWSRIGPDFRDTLRLALGIAGGLALLYVVATNTEGRDQWSRVGVIVILCIFSLLFFAGFEQAGGTFNLFADKNTDRMIGSWEIPADFFQSINAVFIMVLAPLISILWIRLGKYNPNIPVKFALGLLFLGLGFVVMYFGSLATQGGEQLVSPMWLVGVYLLHTIGELSISPIGLSMISKLSPPKITAVMMGFYFGSDAIANYIAGILESIVEQYHINLFFFLMMTSFGAAALCFLLSPFLKRAMRGIS